jgi:uncharacterized protein
VRWTPDRLTVADLFRRTLDTVEPERLIFGTDSSFFPRGYRTNILDDQLAICHDLALSPSEIESKVGPGPPRVSRAVPASVGINVHRAPRT